MQCKAKSKRSGKRCKNHALTGAKVCRMHGGKAPQVQAKAKERRQQQRAEEAVALYGLPREIGPQEALLEEVYRSAGHVAWLAEVVQSLDEPQLVHGVVKTVKLPDGKTIVEARAAYNVWLKLYHDERDRLVRVAKAAVEAGVAERMVEIAEQQAAQLAKVISAILGDLGHDLEDPKTREVVRLHLIKGGKAA